MLCTFIYLPMKTTLRLLSFAAFLMAAANVSAAALRPGIDNKDPERTAHPADRRPEWENEPGAARLPEIENEP